MRAKAKPCPHPYERCGRIVNGRNRGLVRCSVCGEYVLGLPAAAVAVLPPVEEVKPSSDEPPTALPGSVTVE